MRPTVPEIKSVRNCTDAVGLTIGSGIYFVDAVR